MGEIQEFDRALRNALALMAAGGGTVRKEHYSYTFAVRDRFRQEADRLFFESLWRRVRALGEGEAAEFDTKAAFLADLLRIAKAGLEAALPAMPCPAVVRPLGETRARRRFRNWLWGAYSAFLERELRELLAPPEPDGAVAEAARAVAVVLAELAPGALAEARRMEHGSASPVFWRLAALHPETVGNQDRRQEWIAIVRILAVLAEGRGCAPYRRLGEALCDGGDSLAWPWKYRRQAASGVQRAAAGAASGRPGTAARGAAGARGAGAGAEPDAGLRRRGPGGCGRRAAGAGGRAARGGGLFPAP